MTIRTILKLLFLASLFSPSDVLALKVSTEGSVNFGTLMQNQDSSSLSIGEDGSLNQSSIIGFYNPIVTPSSKPITVESSVGLGNYEVAYLNDTTTEIYSDGACTITAKLLPKDKSMFSLRSNNVLFLCTSLPTSKSIAYEVNLKIVGICPEFSQSGNLNIEYTYCGKKTYSGNFGCAANCDGAETTTTKLDIPYSFKLQKPLGVTEIQPLSFGNILAMNGGTLEITTDGAVSPNGVHMFSTLASKPGIFQVYGVGNATMNIVIDSSATLDRIEQSTDSTNTNLANQSKSMNVTGIHATSLTLPNTGTRDAIGYFYVGGVLNVNSNQAPGNYEGNYTVKVSY